MFPTFTIKGFTFHSYGLMLAIGFLSSFTLCMLRFHRKGEDLKLLMTLLVPTILGGFLGSHLLGCIIESQSLSEFFTLCMDLTQGYVFYGGLLTILITTLIYSKVTSLDYLHYTDLIIPTLPAAQGFGRIGCFLAGCCYGKPCSFLSVTFTHSPVAPNFVPLFPIQLLCACFDFIFFFCILKYEKKAPPKGTLTFTYLTVYSLVRFIVEFFRGDARRGFILFLSSSQVFSVVLLFFCGTYLLYRRWIKSNC